MSSELQQSSEDTPVVAFPPALVEMACSFLTLPELAVVTCVSPMWCAVVEQMPAVKGAVCVGSRTALHGVCASRLARHVATLDATRDGEGCGFDGCLMALVVRSFPCLTDLRVVLVASNNRAAYASASSSFAGADSLRVPPSSRHGSSSHSVVANTNGSSYLSPPTRTALLRLPSGLRRLDVCVPTRCASEVRNDAIRAAGGLLHLVAFTLRCTMDARVSFVPLRTTNLTELHVRHLPLSRRLTDLQMDDLRSLTSLHVIELGTGCGRPHRRRINNNENNHNVANPTTTTSTSSMSVPLKNDGDNKDDYEDDEDKHTLSYLLHMPHVLQWQCLTDTVYATYARSLALRNLTSLTRLSCVMSAASHSFLCFMPHLTHLTIDGSEMTADTLAVELLPCVPQLSHLELTNCHLAATHMRMLAARCDQLHTLHLTRMYQMESLDWLAQGNIAHTLRSLHVLQCNGPRLGCGNIQYVRVLRALLELVIVNSFAARLRPKIVHLFAVPSRAMPSLTSFLYAMPTQRKQRSQLARMLYRV